MDRYSRAPSLTRVDGMVWVNCGGVSGEAYQERTWPVYLLPEASVVGGEELCYWGDECSEGGGGDEETLAEIPC